MSDDWSAWNIGRSFLVLFSGSLAVLTPRWMEVDCSWTMSTSISMCVFRAATAEMQGVDIYCVWIHSCAKVELRLSYSSLLICYSNFI